MKKQTFSLLCLVAALAILGLGAIHSIQAENNNNREVPDFNIPRISFNWPGPYTGIISASGRMIGALLYLNGDGTFELSYSYDDIPDGIIFTRGKFEWDKTESNITLDVKDFPPYYRVGENKLTQLDSKGKVITNIQLENYTLEKVIWGPNACNF
jgi:hypothetical protein